MAGDIKTGDIVQLKSGGPKMTVGKIGPWNGVMRAWCEWFNGDKNQSSPFPLSSLKHAD